MLSPVAYVGCRFKGICDECGDEVEGTLIEGEDFVTIEELPVCVTGSKGLGDCGHECEVLGMSEVLKINNKVVARFGDPVTKGIEGVIISGPIDPTFTEFIYSE